MTNTECSPCIVEHDFLTRSEVSGATALAHSGNPIAVLAPRTVFHGGEFDFSHRKNVRPDCQQLRSFRPGSALVVQTGHGVDVIDVDHRNGGGDTFAQLAHLLPEVLGTVETPGGGFHLYVAATGHRSISVGGIDYLARGRIAYLPGTKRPKYSDRGYKWLDSLRTPTEQASDIFVRSLDELRLQKQTPVSRVAASNKASIEAMPSDVFGPAGLLALSHRTVIKARPGTRNRTLYNVAVAFAKRVGENEEALTRIHEVLTSAARINGLLAEDGLPTVRNTIASGIQGGLKIRRAA